MNIKVLNSSYVIDFIDVGFDSSYVKKTVTAEGIKMLSGCKYPELSDWQVYFLFQYTNARSILIYKKGKSSKVEKIKEITIHIPIPTVGHVLWGVNIDQHIYNENHLDGSLKNFDSLDVDYSRFKNREEYIIDCMKRSLHFCLMSGFTVNGIKVKCPMLVP